MDINSQTDTFIDALLRFKLDYDVAEYLSNRANLNWREFELEQHEKYPIKGAGLIASMDLIRQWSVGNRDENLLHLDEDLAPEETGDKIDSFPRSTVSIIYVFSLLEDYGNSVCNHLNPTYLGQRQAWHHKVYGDADTSVATVLATMKEGFAKPFGFNASDIPDDIVEALVYLKSERNGIVHNLEHSHDFLDCFRSVMAIACCIYFLTPNPDARKEIKIYPWEDFHSKF